AVFFVAIEIAGDRNCRRAGRGIEAGQRALVLNQVVVAVGVAVAIDYAVAIEIDQPAEDAAVVAVGGELIEEAAGQTFGLARGELSGDGEIVRAEAAGNQVAIQVGRHFERQINVRRVVADLRVGRVPHEVAVDVDRDSLGDGRTDFGARVDR